MFETSSRSLWHSCFILMRLHHFPVGTKLPFTALAFSMFMGAQSVHAQSMMPLLRFKACTWWLFVFVKHSASCVWNDICDRDVDRLVERTRNRPLASGAISLQWAGCLAFILFLLTLYLFKVAVGDPNMLVFGIACMACVDIPYPLMKRWINFPQLFVGATVAWPIPFAWMSVTGGKLDIFSSITLLVAFGGTTFILDTIYACQDRSDDVQAGVKSATIALGAHLRDALFALTAAVVISFAVAGVSNGQGYFYALVVVGGVTIVLGSHLYTIDFNDKAQCGTALTAFSNHINIAIWVGAIGDYVLRSQLQSS